MPSPCCPHCRWGRSFVAFDGHPAPEGPPAPLMAPRFHPRLSFPLIWCSAPCHGERPAMPVPWGFAGEPAAACHHPAGTFGTGRQPAPLVKTQPLARGRPFAGSPASTRTLPLFAPAPVSLSFAKVPVRASHRHCKPSSSPIPVLPASVPCSSAGPS